MRGGKASVRGYKKYKITKALALRILFHYNLLKINAQIDINNIVSDYNVHKELELIKTIAPQNKLIQKPIALLLTVNTSKCLVALCDKTFDSIAAVISDAGLNIFKKIYIEHKSDKDIELTDNLSEKQVIRLKEKAEKVFSDCFLKFVKNYRVVEIPTEDNPVYGDITTLLSIYDTLQTYDEDKAYDIIDELYSYSYDNTAKNSCIDYDLLSYHSKKSYERLMEDTMYVMYIQNAARLLEQEYSQDDSFVNITENMLFRNKKELEGRSVRAEYNKNKFAVCFKSKYREFKKRLNIVLFGLTALVHGSDEKKYNHSIFILAKEAEQCEKERR